MDISLTPSRAYQEQIFVHRSGLDLDKGVGIALTRSPSETLESGPNQHQAALIMSCTRSQSEQLGLEEDSCNIQQTFLAIQGGRF